MRSTRAPSVGINMQNPALAKQHGPKAVKFVRGLVNDHPNVNPSGEWPHDLPPDKHRGTGLAPAGLFVLPVRALT